VLSGLAHIHEAKLTHGELRAENVLLSDTHAAVCDAGIADALRRSHTAGGDAPPLDARDDIYAVGLLAHEMLTGTQPEPDGEPISKRRSLPSWLSKLLDKCLAPEPSLRWANAGEALGELKPRSL
jgi:serine/threonine-protein kinase